MKIKIEMEIQHCYECPFTEKIGEHGFSGKVCEKCGYDIPKQGILKKCPFNKE